MKLNSLVKINTKKLELERMDLEKVKLLAEVLRVKNQIWRSNKKF